MSLLATATEQHYSTPELAGLPDGWWRLLGLLVIGGLGYAVFWLYRREARVGAPVALRIGLGYLRSAALTLLVVVWLEPVIATYTIRTITANVIVLIDVSASMGIADVDEGDPSPTSGRDGAPADVDEGDPRGSAGASSSRPRVSRIDRVARYLEADDHAWLRRLAARNELLCYTFGEQTTPVIRAGDGPARFAGSPTAQPGGAPEVGSGGAAGASPSPSRLSAVENHTDLGQALTAVLGAVGESPVAGIVVISDGNFNRGMSAEDAAAYARRFKAPIYTVGVGAPREPPNLWIASFAAPATVAKDDPFEVRVEMAAAGIERTRVPLELTEREADGEVGEQRVVATREVLIGGDEPHAEARFKLNAPAAGEFVYQARLAAVSDEAVESDNRREASVLVLDERLRVLLIAGHPSYDYRFVTRLLERDRTIDLSCWLQSADTHAVRDGNTVITELPRRPEEVFQYDALLLLDPDPRELDSAWAITVRRLIDEFGGGVLLQAGPHFTSRLLRDPRLEELVTIFPVIADPDADLRLSEQGAYRTRAYPLRIPEETGAHPLLRLHDDAGANRATWEALPGVWWYLPVLREKPLAAVLMRHGGSAHATRYGQPILMAAQPFGAGRTAFLAFENTWRWRSTAEPHFNNFWVRLVRYLAQPRRQGASKRGLIVLDSETFNRGDYAKIEARVLDAAFVPWHRPEVEGRLELSDGSTRALTLTAVPGRPGWFAGRLAIDWIGPAVIRLPLPGAGAPAAGHAEAETLVKHVRVEGSDVELRSLGLRAESLLRLAKQTGAEYVPLAEAAGLPDRIENASQVRTTRGADEPLWDNGWVLGLIAALLAIEWGLRRRSHLL